MCYIQYKALNTANDSGNTERSLIPQAMQQTLPVSNWEFNIQCFILYIAVIVAQGSGYYIVLEFVADSKRKVLSIDVKDLYCYILILLLYFIIF